MVKRTGSILSTVSSFSNKAKNNILAFKQIYYLPVKKSFHIYLVDIKTKEILFKDTCYTNSTNIIDLKNIKNSNNCCFYSDGFLGIPIFISYDNQIGISMEHSHPPQIYIQSKNKVEIINKLKTKVQKIVYKTN